MKKLSILAIAALFAASLTSCKKDYTCTCVNTGVTVGTVTFHNTKSKAKTSCDALNISGNVCTIQ